MPVNPAAALAIQVAKGILSMGWAFWSVDHVEQSHFGGPPPVTIKMSWPGVGNCQPESGQFGSVWDGARLCSGRFFFHFDIFRLITRGLTRLRRGSVRSPWISQGLTWRCSGLGRGPRFWYPHRSPVLGRPAELGR